MKKWWHMRDSVFVIFFIVNLIFSGHFLPKFKSAFVDNNLTFVVYVISFILSLFLYRSTIFNAIQTLDKSSFSRLINIGFLTFVAEVLGGIALSLFNVESLNQSNIDSANNGNIFLLYLTIVLFAPVVEEIAYRYCIFSLFSHNKIIASIVSVILFSFMHVWNYVIIDKNPQQLLAMLPYMALGTGLCVLYSKTENICLPILLHMSINLISIII